MMLNAKKSDNLRTKGGTLDRSDNKTPSQTRKKGGSKTDSDNEKQSNVCQTNRTGENAFHENKPRYAESIRGKVGAIMLNIVVMGGKADKSGGSHVH